jgi:hypothetical protein
MQFTDIKTKTKVIVLAQQELINKVAELKFFTGKVNLNINLESLSKRNTHPDDSSLF